MISVGFFDPYLDTLGGGEKYLLTILEEAVRTPGLDVTLLSPTLPDTKRWHRLNIDVDPSAFMWCRAGPLAVTRRTRGLDLFVALSNHVPPLSFARRSVAVIQFPFASLRDPGGLRRPYGALRGLDRQLRLRGYETVLCYSEFVRQALVERLEIPAPMVVYPPVDTAGTTVGPKGRNLVAVGRFFPARDANNKKHDVLIDAFQRLAGAGGAPGWTLHLAGGCNDDAGSRAYLGDLRRRAEGLPVRFHPNITAEALASLYQQSAVFWHAAGYGEQRPERLEHFGITTVEAMAYGCVPVVPALGGQPEIVQDGHNGRLWHTLDELVAITADLIDHPEAAEAMRATAARDAQRFSKERFLMRVKATVLEPACRS